MRKKTKRRAHENPSAGYHRYRYSDEEGFKEVRDC